MELQWFLTVPTDLADLKWARTATGSFINQRDIFCFLSFIAASLQLQIQRRPAFLVQEGAGFCITFICDVNTTPAVIDSVWETSLFLCSCRRMMILAEWKRDNKSIGKERGGKGSTLIIDMFSCFSRLQMNFKVTGLADRFLIFPTAAEFYNCWVLLAENWERTSVCSSGSAVLSTLQKTFLHLVVSNSSAGDIFVPQGSANIINCSFFKSYKY